MVSSSITMRRAPNGTFGQDTIRQEHQSRSKLKMHLIFTIRLQWHILEELLTNLCQTKSLEHTWEPVADSSMNSVSICIMMLFQVPPINTYILIINTNSRKLKTRVLSHSKDSSPKILKKLLA